MSTSLIHNDVVKKGPCHRLARNCLMRGKESITVFGPAWVSINLLYFSVLFYFYFFGFSLLIQQD